MAHRQHIRGGLASGRRKSDFPASALRKGTKVELEHVVRPGKKPTKKDIAIATEIAMDHLTESPDYYKYLERMEKQMKSRNRCYAGRYGDRYGRNYAAPRKKTSETWTAYHDRLASMAAEARRKGAVGAAGVLERRAGAVATKHKLVRTRARKGRKSGPGTYPWAQCIKDARARGARDPAAVCGAIRAASRKRYPAYWKARHRKRNPSTVQAKKEAYEAMAASASSVAEALSSKSAKGRSEWLVSAAMYAGQGLAHAEASRDRTAVREASAVATQVRQLIVESTEWKKNIHRAKKKPKRKKKSRNTAATMRGFMRL